MGLGDFLRGISGASNQLPAAMQRRFANQQALQAQAVAGEERAKEDLYRRLQLALQTGDMQTALPLYNEITDYQAPEPTARTATSAGGLPGILNTPSPQGGTPDTSPAAQAAGLAEMERAGDVMGSRVDGPTGAGDSAIPEGLPDVALGTTPEMEPAPPHPLETLFGRQEEDRALKREAEEVKLQGMKSKIMRDAQPQWQSAGKGLFYSTGRDGNLKVTRDSTASPEDAPDVLSFDYNSGIGMLKDGTPFQIEGAHLSTLQKQYEEERDLERRRVAASEGRLGLAERKYNEQIANTTYKVITDIEDGFYAEKYTAERAIEKINAAIDARAQHLGDPKQVEALKEYYAEMFSRPSFRFKMAPKDQQTVAKQRAFWKSAQRVVDLMEDDSVAGAIGRIPGGINGMGAWLSGSANDSEQLTEFKTRLLQLREALLRANSGMQTNEAEMALYKELLGTPYTSWGALKTKLMTAITLSDEGHEAIYHQYIADQHDGRIKNNKIYDQEVDMIPHPDARYRVGAVDPEAHPELQLTDDMIDAED